jgi:tetratricopeptide (TPR) repeat protein
LAGFVLVMVARDYDRGLSAIRRADQLNPNVAFVSSLIAIALTFSGEDLDHALTHTELAIRTSPGDSGAYFYWTAAAFCHFFAGRDEVAVESARQSVDMYPDWDATYWVLIPALTRLGRMDEARSAVEKLQELSPNLTGDFLRRTLPFRDGNMLKAIVSGLTSAGLPE